MFLIKPEDRHFNHIWLPSQSSLHLCLPFFFQSILQAAQYLQGKSFLKTWSHWWLLHHWDHNACQEQLKKGKITLDHGVTSLRQRRHNGLSRVMLAWSFLHIAYSHHRGLRNKERGNAYAQDLILGQSVTCVHGGSSTSQFSWNALTYTPKAGPQFPLWFWIPSGWQWKWSITLSCKEKQYIKRKTCFIIC